MLVHLTNMRLTLAGFILLILCLPALAQPAEGEVESIGFDGYYRPNAIIPMKLRLRPKIGTPATYKLAILQEDMDRDRVLYSRPFTLNGNPEGGRLEEKVWVYFLPQPRDLRSAQSPQELTNVIRIFLCTPAGRQIVQIPILPGAPLLKDLDQPNQIGGTRGTRLILTIGNSQSRPFRTVYEHARGILEETIFQPVSIADLPESVLGYQAVDAIVWLNADPTELAAKSDTSAAIQEYVKNGGHLVVCQNPLAWQKTLDSPLGDLIPVTPTGVEDEKGLASLRRLAELPDPVRQTDPTTGKALIIDPWADTVDKSVPIVRATPKPGAFINLYQASDPASPYLARWMVGLGTVAWTAQDFGDPAVLSTTVNRYAGWAKIWDRTFDWRNQTITLDMARDPADKKKAETVYREVNAVTDLSKSLTGGMEAPSTGAALVALAVVFFIAYWLAAGPGSYFFLLAKKRSHFSWIAFAASAVAATALTMLIVKLVLRGPPELYHVSFVRVSPDSEALIQSQFGLYIKRDGLQRIELKEADPKRTSFIIPYPGHPEQMPDTTGFTAYLQYEVPMRDRNSGEAPAINVPYRSTLKKFRAQWTGRFTGNITGSVRVAGGRLAGRLTNNTGLDLYNVYLAYTPSPSQSQDDWLIEIPNPPLGGAAWPKGVVWDLADIFSRLKNLGIEANQPGAIGSRGMLNKAWMAKDIKGNWADPLRGKTDGTGLTEFTGPAVLISLFDRLEPAKSDSKEKYANDRFELLRRSARHLDASAAVSSGQLLVLAQSNPDSRVPNPLPFPLEVEGKKTAGKGATFYQFIIPLERSGAATQPAEAPDNN